MRSKLKLASIGVSDTAFDTFLESSLQEESKRVVLEVGKDWLHTHTSCVSTPFCHRVVLCGPSLPCIRLKSD